ncbi:hypothetical protein LTR09_002724 [Extremus antarcticus]|uniref:Uncharacterized protein n=1 Tax=Extremus antarcticus TaxID=702011 RepID=A0AAJ0GEX4_9PEZI|nr:hypothetical protein LTR09_002724 [Extremus antarcticus]
MPVVTRSRSAATKGKMAPPAITESQQAKSARAARKATSKTKIATPKNKKNISKTRAKKGILKKTPALRKPSNVAKKPRFPGPPDYGMNDTYHSYGQNYIDEMDDSTWERLITQVKDRLVEVGIDPDVCLDPRRVERMRERFPPGNMVGQCLESGARRQAVANAKGCTAWLPSC